MNYEEHLTELVNSIREDYHNGSITIAKKSLLGLKVLNELFGFKDKRQLFQLIDELQSLKPSMYALKNVLNLLKTKVENDGLAFFGKSIDDVLCRIELSTIKTIELALSYIKESFPRLEIIVLTTSYSSTFLKFVEELSKIRKLQVYVLESKWRGIDYSASTVSFCKKIGVDSNVLYFRELECSDLQFDFVMTGADCVCPGEGIINGIPTKILAEYCLAKSYPFYVLAEEFKFGKFCVPLDGFDFVDFKNVTKIFSNKGA